MQKPVASSFPAALTFPLFLCGFLKSPISDLGTDVKKTRQNEILPRVEKLKGQVKSLNVKSSLKYEHFGETMR